MRGLPHPAIPVFEGLRPRRVEYGQPLGWRGSAGGALMEFRFDDALPILRRTPVVLRELLGDLPNRWTHAIEGPETWSPYDVVGHLIHGERTDWIPRVEHILGHGDSVPLPPFDRE